MSHTEYRAREINIIERKHAGLGVWTELRAEDLAACRSSDLRQIADAMDALEAAKNAEHPAASPVPKPDDLMDNTGLLAAWCGEATDGARFVSCTRLIGGLDAMLQTDWLRRAVAWVNDGEVTR